MLYPRMKSKIFLRKVISKELFGIQFWKSFEIENEYILSEHPRYQRCGSIENITIGRIRVDWILVIRRRY